MSSGCGSKKDIKDNSNMACHRRALVIGINYVNDPANTLAGCCNDARTMKNILIDQYEYTRDEMTFLVDDGDEDSDGEPNRENIVNGMNWLLENADDGCHLFLMYAGHGTQQTDDNGDEEDGKDDCICPSEGALLVDDEMYELLVAPLPTGAKLHIIFDCCHSGTGMDLPWNFLEQDGVWSPVSNEGARDDGCGTVILFSGCRDDQTSADLPEQCGALTKSFSSNLANVTTYAELIEATRQSIIELGEAQIAQLSANDETVLDMEIDF